MKSMLLKESAKKDMAMPVAVEESNKPKYPYGLNFTLNNDSIENLGMADLPEIGTTLILHAKVNVVTVSENETEGGKERTVSLQITDMELSPEGEKGKIEDKLYGLPEPRGKENYIEGF